MLTRQLLGWTALTAAILTLIVAALLAVFRQSSLAIGSLCGFLLGLGSLAVLGECVGWLTPTRRSNPNIHRLIILIFGKYAIIGVTIWALLRVGANGAGMALGLGIVYLAFAVCAIRQALILNKTEEV